MGLLQLNLAPFLAAQQSLGQANARLAAITEAKRAKRKGQTLGTVGAVAGLVLSGGNPSAASAGYGLGASLAGGNTAGVVQSGAALAGGIQGQKTQASNSALRERAATQFQGSPGIDPRAEGVMALPGTEPVAPNAPAGFATLLKDTELGSFALQNLGKIAAQRGGETFTTLTPEQTVTAGFGPGAVVQRSNTTGKLTRTRPSPKTKEIPTAADFTNSFNSGFTAGGGQGDPPPIPAGPSFKTPPDAFKFAKKQAEVANVAGVVRGMETELQGASDRLPALKKAFSSLRNLASDPAFERAEELQEEIKNIERARTDQFGPEFNSVAREMGFSGKLNSSEIAKVNRRIASRDVRQAGRIAAAKGAARTETNLDKPLAPEILRELIGPLGKRLPIKTTMRQAGGLLLKNAKEAPLNAAERERFNSTSDLLADTEEAMKLYTPGWVGPIDGRVTAFRDFTGSATPDRSKFFSLVSKWKNIILKLRSGGAVTTGEAQRLDRELPTMNNSDVAFVSRMRVFQNSLRRIMARDPRDRSAGTTSPRAATPVGGGSFTSTDNARLEGLMRLQNPTDKEMDEIDSLLKKGGQ